MLIQMKKVVGSRLLGRLRGKTDYAKICHELAAATPGEIVILDFHGVSLIAGSWANAMLVSFYRQAVEDQMDTFPVLANIDSECLDDLLLVADWNHQCYLHVKDYGNRPDKADLIGSLDSVQAKTLKVVLEYGEVTGAKLEQLRPQDKVKATAWNNRLKDLYKKRLLRRRKQGREQFYSPVVKEIVYG
ncbi:MAG: DUF4325 domain-containing protein [Thermoguttaceae bacterium]